MKRVSKTVLAVMLLSMGLVTAAVAEDVSENIAVSTTWTSDTVYNLTEQIYVLPGATLTIEAGTLVQSTAEGGGSLAVCRGAQIFVQGTRENPVIMTSSRDSLTSWHEGANEWGNLTIMGRGLISASHYGDLPVTYVEDVDGVEGGEVITHTNNKWPDGMSKKVMEGLVAEFEGDPKVLYGGDDDNDDSGSISFLSIRYGGKVIGLANELNGLSLGAIGRETDINYVEIMNNVDDGIEIWGGTVNLKYVSIWNIGDDSFDVDEGWRGRAQFGLIVQGHSLDAGQGSGVGDNCFETDGAEDADAQPVTTSTIYNFTVVGQPIDGDGGTAWRDNARVQYRNCVFMDLGEQLVRFDDSDGDGANGYSGDESGSRDTSADGTLTWLETWETDAGVHSTVNEATQAEPGDFNHPDTLYQVQTSGKLAEITDSVFYSNQHADAYTEAAIVDVTAAENNNIIASEMPIQALARSAVVQKGGKNIVPVVFINPCAANDAATSVAEAPAGEFFTPVPYRGGFSPCFNWLVGWSAAYRYGMTDGPLTGDLNNDGKVEFGDLFILHENWQGDQNETAFVE